MNGKRRYHQLLKGMSRSEPEYPKMALCPVCARIKVPFGKSCPHKTAESWICDHLDDPVNPVQARYYVLLWKNKAATRKAGTGLSEIAEESK